MKRSTQVSLVLMGVVGIGAGAYALAPGGCRQSESTAAPGDAPRDCRSSHSGGGGGHGFYSTSSASSGSSGTSSAADATSRGGFGGTGRGMSGGE
jgi:hypothetical protein